MSNLISSNTNFSNSIKSVIIYLFVYLFIFSWELPFLFLEYLGCSINYIWASIEYTKIYKYFRYGKQNKVDIVKICYLA